MVQDAFEMTLYSGLYWSRLTPQTNLNPVSPEHSSRRIDSHRGVSGRSGDDDLLGSTLQVGAGLLGGGEDTSGLDNVLGTGLSPLDVGGVSLAVDDDGLVVDVKLAILLLDAALESTVHGVVLEHVDLVYVRTRERRRMMSTYHVLEVNEGAKGVSATILIETIRTAARTR